AHPHRVPMPSITPLNKALILINVVMFVLQGLSGGRIDVFFSLWPLPSQVADAPYIYPDFHVWQLLTYGFLHGGWAHLFFNMFAVYMFGSDIERLFGSRRYL